MIVLDELDSANIADGTYCLGGRCRSLCYRLYWCLWKRCWNQCSIYDGGTVGMARDMMGRLMETWRSTSTSEIFDNRASQQYKIICLRGFDIQQPRVRRATSPVEQRWQDSRAPELTTCATFGLLIHPYPIHGRFGPLAARDSLLTGRDVRRNSNISSPARCRWLKAVWVGKRSFLPCDTT